MAVDEYWHAESESWGKYDDNPEVSGIVWLIGKNGKLNDSQSQRLMDYAGWNGDFDAFVDGSWKPTAVQVQAEISDFQGKQQCRIAWINQYDSIPGNATLNANAAKQLNAQYSSQLRAIRGNTTRNAAPPGGSVAPKPAATEPPKPVPARPAAVEVQPPADGAVEGEPPADDIPF